MTDPQDAWEAASWSERFDLISATVSMVEIAEMLGLEPDRNDKIRLREDDQTPSCQLYETGYYDFGSGEFGDAVDLVRRFDPDLTSGKAAWLIWSRALRAGREPGDAEPQKPKVLHDFSLDLQEYPFVGTNGWDPFGRRLDGTTMLVPHRDENGTYGVKTRGPDGKRSWPGSQFGHRLYNPVGWNPGNTRADDCVICEGESDTWAMLETAPSHDVFGLPSGSATWKDHWMDDLASYGTVWLCFDNDRAGKTALDKVTRKIGWGQARELKVPGLFNDAREAIEAGWEPVF